MNLDSVIESDSVLISALQKFIRRWEIDAAVSVANQLCRPYSDQRWHRLWRRLNIIATEDIGIAHQGMFLYLSKQEDLIRKTANEEQKIGLTLDTVKTLASAKKSRLTDHAFIYLKTELLNGNGSDFSDVSIWDIIQKEHINEEELLQFVVWVYLKNNTKFNLKECWEALMSCEVSNPEEMISLKQAWDTDDCILFLIHACLLVTRNYPSDPVWERKVTGSIGQVEIPDYAYDKHTAVGRQMGRGMKHFIEVGCLIKNRPKDLVDSYYDRLLLLNWS